METPTVESANLEQLADAELQNNETATNDPSENGRVFLLKQWWSKQEILAEYELIKQKVSRYSASERKAISEAAARY